VDFPLWRHYWWCTKRQLSSLWSPRTELPEGCNEATLTYTLKLFKILWRGHTQIKPKLTELFAHPEMAEKVIHVRDLFKWRKVFYGDLHLWR
jgi:hypothetical protein